MNVLGLNFGHDGAVALLQNGIITRSLSRERINRVKRAMTIDTEHIDMVLNDAGIKVSDIDFIALTATQNYSLVHNNPDILEIIPEPHPGCSAFSSITEILKTTNSTIGFGNDMLKSLYDDTSPSSFHRQLFPEYTRRPRESLRSVGYPNSSVTIPIWSEKLGLDAIAQKNFIDLITNDTVRMGFHVPYTVKLHGRKIPAYAVQHHACHAASSFYLSGFNEAAVLTHDGARATSGVNNGMIYFGSENKLWPLIPNNLRLGHLYEATGQRLGFDLHGAAGKLMGLAPYGSPRFFDRAFVGNHFDMIENGIKSNDISWFEHCMKVAATKTKYGAGWSKPLDLMSPLVVDIASSTQKLFEETILAAVETTHKVFLNMKKPMSNLCYAGGVALNCPTNSRIYRESAFENMYIPADCDDSGLAAGSALFLYHNIFDNPVSIISKPKRGVGSYPYLGGCFSGENVETAIAKFSGQISTQNAGDWDRQAAKDIADNKVIAWFEKHSEIGPRALGHRSLIANPSFEANWERVNDLKKREKWRPFAPAVLKDEVSKFFRGAPLDSPYMLYTAQVVTHKLPAITHVDGSARIQTVGPEVGDFYNMLCHVRDLTGIGVVLNTSFNGPGEPIMERPEEALQFLVTSDLEVLYMDGYRITKV